MKKYISIGILILSSFLTASCGSEEVKIAESTTPGISVKVAKVVLDGNSNFLAVSGKIQATNSSDLSTRIMGFVEKVHVKVGDKVQKGDLLVSINNTDLQAKLAQVLASVTEATAAFSNAQKDYDRFKNLYAEKSATQKELDDITAHYKMAKARLEAANQQKNEVQAQFAYSNITAPFSGIITRTSVDEGDMANPGIPLVSIEAPGNFEVMAMVPETEISSIKQGAEVRVLVKSIEKTIHGKVTEVSISSKNSGGQYLVKIAITKTETPVLSGMFVTVQFPTQRKLATDRVLIPKEVLVFNGQLSGVYTVSQSNTALLRWLRLGRTFGDQVEVLSGLSAGELYVVSADGKLFNGAKISIQ